MVQLYGIPKEEGLAYATVVHFVSYIIQVIVGGGFFLRENITSLDKLQEIQEVKN